MTASADRTARVWDAESGQQIGEPMVHGNVIYGAIFSPNGRRIVTASEDKTARIWNAETGEPMGEPMRHDEGLRSSAFSPDGNLIMTVSGRTVQLWKVFTSTQALIDNAKAIAPLCLTPKQRKQYYLSAAPPEWCITGSGGGLDTEDNPIKWQPKWPYRTKAWTDWLVAKRADIKAPLPKE